MFTKNFLSERLPERLQTDDSKDFTALAKLKVDRSVMMNLEHVTRLLSLHDCDHKQPTKSYDFTLKLQ